MIKNHGKHVFAGLLQLGVYTVATAPDATTCEGAVIYVQDGKAGDPVLAYSDGTDWLRVDDGATAIATS
jgi:hypothetical protein